MLCMREIPLHYITSVMACNGAMNVYADEYVITLSLYPVCDMCREYTTFLFGVARLRPDLCATRPLHIISHQIITGSGADRGD